MENENNPLEDELQSSDTLYEHYAFKADPGQSPLRVDKFLMTPLKMLLEIKFNMLPRKGVSL